jgi:hypothetical protein
LQQHLLFPFLRIISGWNLMQRAYRHWRARLFLSTPALIDRSYITQLETTAMRVLLLAFRPWFSSIYWLFVLAVTLQFDSEIVRQATLGGPQDLVALATDYALQTREDCGRVSLRP